MAGIFNDTFNPAGAYRTYLHHYAQQGDVEKLKQRIAQGDDLEAVNRLGYCPLFYAIQDDNLEAMRELLEAGASASQCREKHVLLNQAVSRAQGVEMTRLLLAHGSNPNLVDQFGNRPVDMLWPLGNSEGKPLSEESHRKIHILKMLVARGASVKGLVDKLLEQRIYPSDTLLLALGGDRDIYLSKLVPKLGWGELANLVWHGREDVAQALVDTGVDVNQIVGYWRPLGDTNLVTVAIYEKQLDIARRLLEAGAEPEPRLLRWAAKIGHEEVVSLLLDAGIDPKVSNSRGDTPISLARSHGHAAVVKLLRERGGEARAQVKERKPLASLWEAVGSCRTDGVAALINGGADVNAVDKRGFSLLQRAVNAHRCFAVADELIEHGADIDYRRHRHKQTALHFAVNSRVLRVQQVKFLLSRGAEVNARDALGNTPLMALVLRNGRSRRGVEVAKILLEYGADLSGETHAGETVVSAARDAGNQYLLDLFKKHP